MVTVLFFPNRSAVVDYLIGFLGDIRVLGGTFDTPREYFNPNGDKSMKRVYAITKFDK